ncbi:MAG: LLM class flavin-dependent oxidoreductase [Actinobacteria bacterium]|nr:LLM class flavin-dependent oxidoreductase [Actinomycetota bacterium]NCG39260.1 LLM class flavin-dependent oxidoreductase [Actinomycetota bacterium]
MSPHPSSFILGLQIVPTMSIAEIVDTICVAEELGYDHCMVADEGLMQDVFVCLGAAAGLTKTIRLGVVTNGYTRHPAAIAAALASVNELSGGRAFVTLVAGGTMVLQPMGIERNSPLAVMDDTIEVLRSLWSGESIEWEGKRERLDGAQLSHGPQSIPIWVAARGERILALAGQKADALVLMAKSDLADAIKEAGQTDREFGLMYLDRLAFTPEMIEEARGLYGYAILDSPPRVLRNLGIDDATMGCLREAFASGGAKAIAPLVTDDMVAAYQIAGTHAECRSQLEDMIVRHRLDGFFINIIGPGLDTNRALLADVAAIVRGSS